MPTRAKTPPALVAIPLIERAAHQVGLVLSRHGHLDVTQAEAHVLAFLHTRAAARINDIHEAFGHKRSTLTSLIDRLETRKLVTRANDSDDRRTVVIKLTRTGVALSSRVHAALLDVEHHALKAFSDNEVAAFMRVIDAFASSDVSDGSAGRFS